MTNNAEFIVIIIVAVILLIALILVCTCCWRSINILASEHGTAKREALANHLRNRYLYIIDMGTIMYKTNPEKVKIKWMMQY